MASASPVPPSTQARMLDASDLVSQVQHLIPHEPAPDLFNHTARHLFLTHIALLFSNTPYPLSSLLLVRGKLSKNSGSANLRGSSLSAGSSRVATVETQFYAAICVANPSHPSGLKVLIAGPLYKGEEQSARVECIRALRDVCEVLMHERMSKALRDQQVDGEPKRFTTPGLSGAIVDPIFDISHSENRLPEAPPSYLASEDATEKQRS